MRVDDRNVTVRRCRTRERAFHAGRQGGRRQHGADKTAP
jgi:hypothetical protein